MCRKENRGFQKPCLEDMHCRQRKPGQPVPPPPEPSPDCLVLGGLRAGWRVHRTRTHSPDGVPSSTPRLLGSFTWKVQLLWDDGLWVQTDTSRRLKRIAWKSAPHTDSMVQWRGMPKHNPILLLLPTEETEVQCQICPRKASGQSRIRTGTPTYSCHWGPLSQPKPFRSART